MYEDKRSFCPNTRRVLCPQLVQRTHAERGRCFGRFMHAALRRLAHTRRRATLVASDRERGRLSRPESRRHTNLPFAHATPAFASHGALHGFFHRRILKMRIAFLLLTAFAVGCEPIIFMDELVERVDPELHNAVEFFELRAEELRDAWEFSEPLSPRAEDLAAYDLVAARLVEQMQRLQEWESVSDNAKGVLTLRSLAIHYS